MNQQTPIPAETTMCALPEFQRLSVNINAESAQILTMVKSCRGINTTEAVRRAIGLLERSAVAAAGAEPDPPGSGDGSTGENENPNPERW